MSDAPKNPNDPNPTNPGTSSGGWKTVPTHAYPQTPQPPVAPSYPSPPQQSYPPPAAQQPPQYNYPPPPAYPPLPPQQPAYPGQGYAQPPKKRKTWLWVLLIVLTVLILGMVGCFAILYNIGKSHMAVTPDGAVKTLHAHMKAHEVEAIYQEADPSYKSVVGREKSNAAFDNVDAKLGAPTTYRIMETKPTKDSAGAEVVDLYVLTTFEKGSANESIELRRGVDGMLHMTAYGAESDNLR